MSEKYNIHAGVVPGRVNAKASAAVFEGTAVNLDALTIGALFSREKFVEECPKCKRAGVRWKRTVFAHALLYLQQRAGSNYVDVKRFCKVDAPPKVVKEKKQTGFFFCPKDKL